MGSCRGHRDPPHCSTTHGSALAGDRKATWRHCQARAINPAVAITGQAGLADEFRRAAVGPSEGTAYLCCAWPCKTSWSAMAQGCRPQIQRNPRMQTPQKHLNPAKKSQSRMGGTPTLSPGHLRTGSHCTSLMCTRTPHPHTGHTHTHELTHTGSTVALGSASQSPAHTCHLPAA